MASGSMGKKPRPEPLASGGWDSGPGLSGASHLGSALKEEGGRGYLGFGEVMGDETGHFSAVPHDQGPRASPSHQHS